MPLRPAGLSRARGAVGGLAFEAKFDGYRCLLSTSTQQGDPVLLHAAAV
ncbi:hypothetical protein [Streptomyces chryseus]|nr:hypothetical protein [Streptomyces chryseus]